MADTWWVQSSQLDDGQKQVIQLPQGGKHLVIGPPGSGKTNLLLLRANYLHLCGYSNICIVVFNRLLKEFIVSGASEYAFDSDRVKTLSQWQRELLSDSGLRVAPPAGFSARQDYLDSSCSELVASLNGSKLFDAVLLDEAQDYTKEQLDVFLAVADQVFAVGDDRQRVYAPDSFNVLKGAMDEVHELKFHYRNGLNICQFADGLPQTYTPPRLLVPRCQYRETVLPSKVTAHSCRSVTEQGELVAAALRTQVAAYPDELLGVLCPRNDEADIIYDLLSSDSALGPFTVRQSFESGYEPFAKGACICVSSMHGSKGLEFRTVHLAGLEMLKAIPRNRSNLLYTAVTRAKTTLSLYGVGALPGQVMSAFNKMQPQRSRPSIDDVFGGKQ